MTGQTLDTVISPFSGWNIATLLDQQAKNRSDHPFLIWEPFEGEPRTWTYREFSLATEQLATGLANRGIEKGDFVLIHLENCPEYLMTWFACARLGAIAVTTNIRSAGEELNYYAEFAGVKAAVTQPKFEALVSENCPDLHWMALIETDPVVESVESSDSIDSSSTIGSSITRTSFNSLFIEETVPKVTLELSDPLCVMYTSGTTSRPKGVVWTHGNGLWSARCSSVIEGLVESDVHQIVLPLFHMNALSASVLPSLWVGSTIVLQPKFSVSRFWDVAIRNRCTWGSLVPFCVRALMQHDVPEHNFRVWAIGVNGLVDKKFKVRVIGWWGMTETVTVGIAGSVYHDDTPLTLGRPTPFYQIAVLGPDGAHVNAGDSGELRIKGIPGLSIFDHYLNNKEATESSYDEAGFFKTGDRVRVNKDGTLSFEDRLKDMLKVGGENVSAAEIERVIAVLPEVSEAAVVGKPDEMLNEVPVVFVLPLGQQNEDELKKKITAACEKSLADFKRPHDIKIVDSLPRATLEKVAKVKLRDQLLKESES